MGNKSLAAVAALLVAALAPTVHGQQIYRSVLGDSSPQMKDVPDVLFGRTLLLPQDDAGLLVMSSQSSQVQFVPLYSQNSAFQQQPPADTGLSTTENFTSPSVPISSASGRMFNNANDVVISVGPGPGYVNSPTEYDWQYSYWNPANGTHLGPFNLKAALWPNQRQKLYTRVVMGNFQGNNLQSPLIFVETDFGGYVLWQMNIVAATNINQVDQIDEGGGSNPTSGDATPSQAPVSSSIVVGDFNRDGIDEVAVLLRDGQTVVLYTVNPKSLELSNWQTIKLPAPLTKPTLVAGRFNGSPYTVLAAVGEQQGSQQMTVDYIDPITNPAQPSVTMQTTTFAVPNLSSKDFEGAFAQAAPVYNTGMNSLEQLVLGLKYYYNSWHALLIGTFDQKNDFVVQQATGYAGCLLGMEVGNFNNQDSSSNVNPNLQIALFKSFRSGSECVPPFDNGALHVEMRNIAVPQWAAATPQAAPANGPTDWLDTLPVTELTPNLNGPLRSTPTFVIGDLQGRSMRLGAPEHITLTKKIQPNFVLGMAPMHVDWMQPLGDTKQSCQPGTLIPGIPECILNLDVAAAADNSDRADSFSNTFSVTGTDSTQTTRTSTTSWGVSVKVSVGQTDKFGVPAELSGSVSLKASVGNVYKGVKDTYNVTYSSKQESLTNQTGFDDEVFFTSQTQNIYNYPILGRVDANNNQVYATYSVPSHVQMSNVAGSTLDWYQPVHEPGNVLSYPDSSALLAQEFAPGNISPQASMGCEMVGPNSVVNSIQWNNRQQTSTKSGWTDALSEAVNFSASLTFGETILGEGASVKGTDKLDVSGSQAWGRLTQTINTDTASQAVVFTMPKFDNTASSKFAYAFDDYVYGTTNALPPYQSSSSLLPNDLDVLTTGPLFIGFTADPTKQCGGGGTTFWTAAYSLPDVGFNHPDRWEVPADNLASFNSPLTPSESDPLISQSFYRMKGLFITTGGPSTGSGAFGAGTVETVPAGQSIWLSARVYNFSLNATNQNNAGSTVHVRFYGQRRCQITYPNRVITDLCPNGAFLIGGDGADGDVVISSIPAFHGPSDAPNWVIASVKFDTTAYANTDLVFWAVTWLEDASGNVIAETPGHGVKIKSFAGVKFKNINDVPVEAYSNNVGFYGANHPFHVDSPLQPASLLMQAAAVPETALRSVDLGLLSKRFRVDRPTHFIARFTADQAFPGSSVLYFDGEPAHGGKLFDIQSVHPLRPGESTEHLIKYRAERCGSHTLYAVVETEGLPARMGSISAQVTINPVDEVARMMEYIKALKLPSPFERALLANLAFAKRRFEQGNLRSGLATLRVFKELVRLVSAVSDDELINETNVLLKDAKLIQSCERELGSETAPTGMTLLSARY